MIRVCMFCNKVFGEKKPLYDKTLTHGICDPCFGDFRAKYENQEIVGQKAKIGELPKLNWLTTNEDHNLLTCK